MLLSHDGPAFLSPSSAELKQALSDAGLTPKGVEAVVDARDRRRWTQPVRQSQCCMYSAATGLLYHSWSVNFFVLPCRCRTCTCLSHRDPVYRAWALLWV
jgi:hypothetical protein